MHAPADLKVEIAVLQPGTGYMAIGKQVPGAVHQKSGALTSILVNTGVTGSEPVFR